MIQEKKCKGNGDASGHGCGKLVPVSLYNKTNRIYGIGLSCGCYGKWLITTEKGREKMSKSIIKAQKPRKDLEDAQVNKKARTSLGALKQQTERLFNKYVRIRDEGKPCISSNIPYKSDFDAGHCFSVKSYEGLRYDFDNVHGQSIGDNRFKDGNEKEYLLNLPSRIGKERTDKLVERAMEYKKNGHKFSRPELMDIQAEVKNRIKELNKYR